MLQSNATILVECADYMLIRAEGAKTPAGVWDRGDTAGAKAPWRLHKPPAENEAPGAQINRQVEHNFLEKFKKIKAGEENQLIFPHLLYPTDLSVRLSIDVYFSSVFSNKAWKSSSFTSIFASANTLSTAA
ncbi:hypothetical protein SAMN05877753_103390 [Bacillus oleivorans]|uniref:Uncharacterized protein n=1 Tax=Bacillus oleivorans TaxID=1448271 RepID=A0A285CR23_9BACI|nr:hypothetical protein SAMN05877753_103390 [Bacillus oleivorans]